jgi:hypothetical protein
MKAVQSIPHIHPYRGDDMAIQLSPNATKESQQIAKIQFNSVWSKLWDKLPYETKLKINNGA